MIIFEANPTTESQKSAFARACTRNPELQFDLDMYGNAFWQETLDGPIRVAPWDVKIEPPIDLRKNPDGVWAMPE